MFRLKSVYIKDYKNIQDQTFDFSSNTGYIALIGLNGSGKSNLLEAINIIFNELLDIPNTENVNGYSITFQLNDIEYTHSTVDDTEEHNLIPLNAVNKENLPSSVIACYSGEDLRLWHIAYEEYYMQYFKNAIRDRSFAPKIIYINKYCWKIAFISLLCSAKDSVKEFLKNVFSIDDIRSVDIHLEADAEKREKFASHTACKWYDSIKHLQDEDENQLINANTLATTDMMMYGAPNSSAPDYVFQFLYLLSLPKKDLKKKQTVDKLINNIKININGISFDNLSEGEKKLILIETITQILGDENSLVLLDEPDAHVHIENKKKILETITQYNGQTILTTHSPSICKYIPNGIPLYLCDNGKNQKVNNHFEAGLRIMPDTSLSYLLFNSQHLVITEGKTDCLYINKAISLLSPTYPILEHSTDFISVGGTDPDCVKELLMRIPDIENRKIIVLVDRDEAGLKCAKGVISNQNLKKQDLVNEYPLSKKNSMLLMLPNNRGDQKDFVIEDYFSNATIRNLTISKIQTDFLDDTTFLNFPKVKKDLKDIYLPSYAEGCTNAADFEGFKILLNKLEAILR